MRKMELMLNDAFEATGQWWLPHQPADKLYGTLRYSPANIELELSGMLDDETAKDLAAGSPTFKDHPCIHGLTHDHQKFTILRAHAWSVGSTTKYVALHVIADKHVPPISELKFRQVSFYCQHLELFIARRPFTMENEGQRENFKSCTVKYHQPEQLVWRIDEIDTTLDFQMAMKLSSNAYEQWHKLHAKSFVTITPASPQDLDWFQRHIWRFCYFLTLVTDEVVSPTAIQVFLEGDKYPGWHLHKAANKRAPGEKATPLLLFHLAHLVDQFESMLRKWFSVDETMLDAIHLMMDAQRTQDHSTQGRFLLLAHAVEVVSRATTRSEYMTKEDYEKVATTLYGAIPKEVGSDHRMSLKNRIKYGHEYAFHKRIKVLLESLSDEGRGIVCRDPAKFSTGIADTRNYYTHFTDELRPKALPQLAMYWASEKLSFLMRIVLFKYLGIEEAVVVQRMTKHHRLSQLIYYSKEHPESMKVD